METCYRHPDRETGVSCSNCGRPICTDCMTATPVGVRCPECAGRRTRVPAPALAAAGTPVLTYALIAVNVAVFLVTNKIGSGGLFGGGDINHLGRQLALDGPDVANGDTYRLITSAFLHFGIAHIAFNMYALYWLGSILEGYAGTLRFGAIYFISALAGSLGALIATPNSLSGGASGAIFGLMGALLVMQRQRGRALLEGPIGMLLVINLVFTFTFPGISVGGHLGGLAGGVVTGLVLSRFGRRNLAYAPITPLTAIALVGLAAATVAGSVAVA